MTPGLELRAAAERHARGEGGAFIGFVQVRFARLVQRTFDDAVVTRFDCPTIEFLKSSLRNRVCSTFCVPESNFCCVCRIKCLVKGFVVTMFWRCVQPGEVIHPVGEAVDPSTGQTRLCIEVTR